MTIIKKQDNEKGVLQCRSCKKSFHQSELTRIQTELLGQQVIQSVCPYCGSNTYGLVDYPVSEEELIYKNGKFYLHSGKDIKHRINRLIYEEE